MKKIILSCALVFSVLSFSAWTAQDGQKDKVKNPTECCCGECACTECTCATDCSACTNCQKNENCQACQNCNHEGNCCQQNPPQKKHKRGGCCKKGC